MTTASSTSRLNRQTAVNGKYVEPPRAEHFELPETILQFGTGAFLRGFSDVFVDEANRQGIFGGRVVVVGSTGSARVRLINEQDGLYTVCVQGISDGKVVEHYRVVGSLSRAIAATRDWSDVVTFARSPDLRYVISNTTEVGIQFDPDDRQDLDPPRSFPGKLASVLHERAHAFDFDPSRGLVILCCELIEGNGDRLRQIILKLGDQWSLGEAFTNWVERSCLFCNTLVDRIVPGEPEPERRHELEARLGYRDELAVQAEPYGLWAIEGDDSLRETLPFSTADPAIVITDDISPYRERKVRILNGAHSILVPVSFLCGNDTVRETMEDPRVSRFVRGAMLTEIVPSMDIDRSDAERFAGQVLDRFANPFVNHELLSIALHQTSKMNVRVRPSLEAYVNKQGELPQHLAFGFAAFLVFVLGEGRSANARLPTDESADVVRELRSRHEDLHDFVRSLAADERLWDNPLADLPKFVDTVARYTKGILDDGASQALDSFFYAMNGRD